MAGPGQKRAIPKSADYADVEAAPEHLVAEIIGGELMTHPRPSVRHGAAEMGLSHALVGPFQYDPEGPGGWVFLREPELMVGEDLLVPDIAAWRRERFVLPLDNYHTILPDWVCEVLSASTEKRDRTIKMAEYGRAGISHFWLVDPRQQLLEVFESKAGRWTKIADFNSAEMVRAAPFDAIEFSLANLWPLDRPLGFHEDPQHLYAGDR